MSPENGPAEVITGVLDTLRQSRSLLLDPTPGNIDCCRIALSRCINTIADLLRGERSQWKKRELRDQLLQIRGELNTIAQLLDSAAAVRRGMLSALSAANRPHVADFDSGAEQTVSRVHVLG